MSPRVLLAIGLTVVIGALAAVLAFKLARQPDPVLPGVRAPDKPLSASESDQRDEKARLRAQDEKVEAVRAQLFAKIQAQAKERGLREADIETRVQLNPALSKLHQRCREMEKEWDGASSGDRARLEAEYVNLLNECYEGIVATMEGMGGVKK